MSERSSIHVLSGSVVWIGILDILARNDPASDIMLALIVTFEFLLYIIYRLSGIGGGNEGGDCQSSSE